MNGAGVATLVAACALIACPSAPERTRVVNVRATYSWYGQTVEQSWSRRASVSGQRLTLEGCEGTLEVGGPAVRCASGLTWDDSTVVDVVQLRAWSESELELEGQAVRTVLRGAARSGGPFAGTVRLRVPLDGR